MNIMKDTECNLCIMQSPKKSTLNIYNSNLRTYLHLLNVKDVAKNVKCFLYLFQRMPTTLCPLYVTLIRLLTF